MDVVRRSQLDLHKFVRGVLQAPSKGTTDDPGEPSWPSGDIYIYVWNELFFIKKIFWSLRFLKGVACLFKIDDVKIYNFLKV